MRLRLMHLMIGAALLGSCSGPAASNMTTAPAAPPTAVRPATAIPAATATIARTPVPTTPPTAVVSPALAPTAPAAFSPAPAGSGTISGKLGYPAEGIPALVVVAFPAEGAGPFYAIETEENQQQFTIAGITPGVYHVVAYRAERTGTLTGGYTQAVPCGLSVTCTNHSLLPIEVKPGQTISGVEVTDWYAPDGAFPPLPGDWRSRLAAAPTAASPATLPFARTLRLQDPHIQGQDVKAAQQRLLALGYAQVGAADGIFGPNTASAVRTFQLLNDLEVDGILGPRTWERLFSPAANPGSTVAPVVASDTGWLLGGAYARKWLDGPTTATLLRGGERYRLVGSTGLLGTTSGDQPTSLGLPCELAFRVNLAPPPTISQTLALGGSWNPWPRAPIEENPDTQAYRQLVADLLRANGIAAPDVRLTRVLRIDLEGDGTEELLIAATRLAGEGDFPSSSVAAGDYSLAVVRTTIDGAERIIDLATEYYPKAQEFAAPNKHTLVAAADLNGDGRMEIVVDSAYYEGEAIFAYSVDGDRTEAVLQAGCGV
jgi:Putative peptidoglycan binding domain